MKKFFLFAALAVFVGSTQAASLNWAAVNVYEPGTTTVASGYSIYLFITEQSSNFGAGVTTVDDVIDLIKSGPEVITDESTGKETGLKKGTTIIDIAASSPITNGRIPSTATGYNGNNFAAGNSLSGFAVIFDAATLTSAEHYIVTDVKSASWTSGTGAKSLNFGTQANATWVAVPEPSTAALALAGLALLLKRRKA